MAIIDIRDHDEGFTVDGIQFGDDEFLIAAQDEDSDIFYVRSAEKLVPVYLGSIENMIAALEQAKELWYE